MDELANVSGVLRCSSVEHILNPQILLFSLALLLYRNLLSIKDLIQQYTLQ